MSYKFKDLEVNWEIIYDFLYVFLINFSHNMLRLWKTTNVIQGQIL